MIEIRAPRYVFPSWVTRYREGEKQHYREIDADELDCLQLDCFRTFVQ